MPRRNIAISIEWDQTQRFVQRHYVRLKSAETFIESRFDSNTSEQPQCLANKIQVDSSRFEIQANTSEHRRYIT